jgi:segregation and condensation protein B
MDSIKDAEAVIEAVLFAAGDPVPFNKISEIIGHDKKTTRMIMNKLISQYHNSHRGIMIREIDNQFQFCTKPEYDEYIAKLGIARKKHGLTYAAYETLSIIAYNQPVTRAYIEEIRGVGSDSVIMTLLTRNLIREAGRDSSPGKPKLYETTEEFLRVFGFSSLKDLPPLELGSIPEVYEDIPLD